MRRNDRLRHSTALSEDMGEIVPGRGVAGMERAGKAERVLRGGEIAKRVTGVAAADPGREIIGPTHYHRAVGFARRRRA